MIDDPKNMLSDIDWHTRAMIKKLATQFQKQTKLGIRIRAGLRSCSEQNNIYAQGRTSTGPIVTNAAGCKSWHVMGRAVDLDPFDPVTGKTLPGYSDAYLILGSIWQKLGGVWGGEFDGIDDKGHFEWHPNLKITTACPDATSCNTIKIQRTAPTYLIASIALLLAATGIFTATILMPSHR